MYKSFVKTAKKQDQYLAEFSFILARNAEDVHRKLFIQFLKAFDNDRSYNYKQIFICKICGNVILDELPSICPICEHDKVFFEEI
jgi:rubrerythrin